MKTKISFLISYLTFVMNCHAQTIPEIYIDGQTLGSQSALFYSPGKVISTSSPSALPTTVTGNNNVDFRAGVEIALKNGFSANNSNPSVNFSAKIEAPAFNVAFLEPNQTYPMVGEYEKLQIGLELPSSINAEVDNYVYYVDNQIEQATTPILESNTVDFSTLNSHPEWINPYDPSKISVEAIFYHYDANGQIDHSLLSYGFYHTDCKRNLNNGWDKLSTPYPWRLRFAPDRTGKWGCDIYVFLNKGSASNQVILNVNKTAFECIPSSNPGFLKVASDQRHLKFSKTNDPFFPIGQNITWVDSWWPMYPIRYNDNSYTHEVQNFDLHNNYIANIGNNQGNFARIVTEPSMSGLEWYKIGYYRQFAAHEMDELFEKCKISNVYLNWCVYMHAQFSSFIPGDADPPFNVVIWPQSPYKNQIAGISEPIDLLTNVEAKTHFKNYFRYVIARWGYSTNLGVLNLFSEHDQWDTISELDTLTWEWRLDNDAPLRADLHAFYADLSDAIKDSDPAKHLLSTTFIHDEFPTPHPYQIPEMDICGSNNYNDGNTKNDAYNTLSSVVNNNLSTFNKPYLFSETGMTSGSNGFHAGTIEGCSDVEFHNIMWSTPFMNTYGVALNWWQWKNDNYRQQNYPAMASFFQNENFENYNYTPQKYYIDENGQIGNPVSGVPGIKAYYLVDPSAGKALGWVQNDTYYWGNVSEDATDGDYCNDQIGLYMPLPADDDTYDVPTSITQPIKILMNLNQDYKVSWYSTRNNGEWFADDYVSTNPVNPILSFMYPANAPCDDMGCDMAFKVELIESRNYQAEGSIKNNPLDIYPNPNSGSFTVISQSANIGNVKITDMLGQIIFSKNGIAENKMEIQLENATQGIYLVEVLSPRTKPRHTKIVVK